MGAPAGFLVSPHQKLPRICLKCATSEEVRRKSHVFSLLNGGSSGGMIGGVVGVSIASMARNSPELLLPVLIGLGVVVAGGILYFKSTERKVAVKLPLCGACHARFDGAKRIQKLFLGAILLEAALAAIGLVQHSTDGLVASGVFFAMTLAAAFALQLQKRVLYLVRSDADGHVLGGVSDDAQARIQAAWAARSREVKQAA